MLLSHVIEKGKPRYLALKSYDQKDALKQSGFKWNPDNKVWETSDSFKAKNFISFADQKTFDILVPQIQEYERIFQISTKKTSDIQVPCPTGLAYLDHQKVSIEFIGATVGSLISGDCGVGKTIIAVGAINYFQWDKVLIVCPNTIKLNWKKEINKWLTLPLSTSIIYPDECELADINIINYDLLVKYNEELCQQWDVVIVDESSFIKENSSKRYKALSKILEHADKKIFMSGTPILNKPRELWTTIKELSPSLMTKSYFEKRYCGGYLQDIWVKKYNEELGRSVPTKIQIWNTEGSSNLEELNTLLRHTIMIRYKLNDVMDLPDKIRQVIFLNSLQHIVDQEKLEYAKLKESYERGEIESVRVLLAEVSKIRHKTALAKVPQVIEFVNDILENEEKVVIFCHHKDVADAYYKAFNCVKITGDDSVDERQEAIDKFQNDPETRVIVLSLRAASLGITLTAGHVIVFAELDWTPSIMNQAEARCMRYGQKERVLAYYLVVEGSIDGNIVNKLIGKQEIIDKAIDFTPESDITDVEIMEYINES